MILSHEAPEFRRHQARLGKHKYNGSYYYSKELCENIIPYVKADRPWVTVNAEGLCCDRAIVFIHSNVKTERVYRWLREYEDLVLICGLPETVEKVKHLGRAFYLPLSIDTEYVKQFRTDKDRDTAFAGRVTKDINVPDDVPRLQGMPRDWLLLDMARFEYVYAVGRTALEALALDCKLLPYDPRFPDPARWKLLDNKDVIPMLQKILDEVDR